MMIYNNKFLTLLTVFTTLLLTAPISHAQESTHHIVAVVNGEAITNQTLEARMAIIMDSSGIANNPENQKRLLPQVLQTLIDEQLQQQDALKKKVALTDEEFTRALDALAKQLNVEDVQEFIKKRGLNVEVFLNQLRAQLLWQKMVITRIRPKVYVSAEDVAAERERMLGVTEATEYNLKEIVLPVLSPEEEEQTKLLAESLVAQLAEGGNFEAIAKQFSKASSAENGGNVGWLNASELNSNVREYLDKAQPGTYVGPVRTSVGYLIVSLNERRSSQPTATAEDEKTNNEIREKLLRRKLDLEARRTMTDLRRGAFIERRIGSGPQ